MKYKKLLLFLLVLFLVGFLKLAVKKNNPPVQTRLPAHPLFFYDENSFYAGVKQAQKENKVFLRHISGGIIPHHLFGGVIISDFFSRLSKQNPKTVILIGPNHFERGDYQVLSSLYEWETPFGKVMPNEAIIRELVKEKIVGIDENVLPKDHAVSGIMPYVKYYLPETQVVPLLLSGFMTQEDVRQLSGNLSQYLSLKTIIIAAVDFSHQLTSPKAQEKDKITLELMKSFNYSQLLTLNNEYLDSPPSIVTLLMNMQSLGTTETELLYHTNSGEMQKDNSIETTSYFSIVYY